MKNNHKQYLLNIWYDNKNFKFRKFEVKLLDHKPKLNELFDIIQEGLYKHYSYSNYNMKLKLTSINKNGNISYEFISDNSEIKVYVDLYNLNNKEV